ncbi:hypothetical protein [Halorubrum sp. SP9]|uniref:hypothetical protein n=1 Tax=Halorubrum sp. SP9 TaxID=1537267 RepID=UPI001A7E0D4C|nr:hypothetical protein [Halorubrum sp. SP9]
MVSQPVREETVEIYCKAFCSGTTDGRDTDCFVAVCLSLAAQKVHEPIPRSRLIDAVSVTKTAFNSSQKAIRDSVDVEVFPSGGDEYIPFLSSELNLSDSECTSATNLLESTSGSTELIGKSPIGVASAAVYLTSARTQRQVAEAGGISAETVRQRVSDIRRLEQL